MREDRNDILTKTFEQINSAGDVSQLREIHGQMKETAWDWKKQEMAPPVILRHLNGWHDKLMSRTLELVLEQMEQSDRTVGIPPFCWIVLGSGGREEQTLSPDQDNALMYLTDSEDGQREAAFFREFAEKAVAALERVGYPYCPGYVMASNPRWNQSVAGWQRSMESYLEVPNWDNTRYLMMASDMRAIFGSRELARGFRDWLIKRLRHQSFIHWQMADHIGSHQVPLDFWGRFRTDQRGSHANQLNIKEGGYLPLVNLTRLWSITAGIQDTNTDCRIDALMRRWFWDERFGNRVKEAFHTFLGHRIWGHYLEPDSLTEREKNALKTALETVRHLQKQSVQHFRKPK